jgi:hypothetical protein
MRETQQFLIIVEDPSEVITVSGALNESYDDSVLVSDHPIGRDANVIDHIQPLPAALSADLLITDTPSRVPTDNIPDGYDLVTQQHSYAGQEIESVGPTIELQRGRIIYQRLLELKTAGARMAVATSRRLYGNMVIVSVSPTVSNDDWTLVLPVVWREVQIANSRETSIKVVAEPKLKTSADAGTQETSTEDAASAGPPQDLLGNLADAASRIFG